MKTSFFDRLTNLITGLGTEAKDKTTHDQFELNIIDKSALENAYRGDWLSRKIVDIIPFDMTREGWNWQAKESQIERLEDREKKLKLGLKVYQALVKARLYGGAGIYIGIKGANPAEELKPETVTKDSIEYIHVFTRHDLSNPELDLDLISPWFGLPKHFQLSIAGGQQSQIEIHPSRVILFQGMPHPDPLRAAGTDCWGDSTLQIVWDAVRTAASSQQHVGALIPEAKVDVITVPGLSDALSTEAGTKKVVGRFQGAAMIKSMFGFVLTEGDSEGGGEQYQQKQIRFTEFPDLLRQFLQVAAGAADVPVTRLLNQSPTGLNNNGEGDLKNYYDNIKARQKHELKPQLDVLFEVLIRDVFGSRPKSIYYEFAALWQMSAKEQAEIEKMRAETDNALVGGALVPAPVMEKATRNRLIESGLYPGIEDAYEEFDADPEQQALANAAKGLDPDGNPLPKEPAPGEEDPDAEGGDDEGGNPREGSVKLRVVASKDAAPRSLYVRRDVINKGDIERWAREQGFETVVPDMHVTLIHSRTQVDWFKVYTAQSRLEIPEGGPRLVEPLGNKGAIVLLFSSDDLSWRHDHFKRIGAESDYDPYQPHITLTYDKRNVVLEDIEPYTGRIVFGPELFDQVDDGWRGSLQEEKVL